MSTPDFRFNINSRSVTLDANRTRQLLNATSEQEAYRTQGGGVWSKFCDYFCLGSDRKVIKDLFNAITNAPGNISPEKQLCRFQKLASHAKAGFAGRFIVSVGDDHYEPHQWNYSLCIDGCSVFKSKNHPKTGIQEHKQFLLGTLAWNTQHQADGLPGKGAYLKGQIECASDVEMDKSVSPGNGTSREYLTSHMLDPRFCKDNFRGVRDLNDNPTLFDAIFEFEEKPLILRLSNRSGATEFRGEVVKKALKKESYNNLSELFLYDYGTENDAELQYTVAAQRMHLINLIGNDFLSEPHDIFNGTRICRRGADKGISIGQLLGTPGEPSFTEPEVQMPDFLHFSQLA